MSGSRHHDGAGVAPRATERDRGPGNFANPGVVVRSWYAAARSRDVRRGEVQSFNLLGRRVALYRDAFGRVRALDARCPHLGADLGHGAVAGDGVRCALHHWELGPDGACRRAPGLEPAPPRRTRAYPVVERWNLLWLFNGPRADFDLPGPRAGGRLRVLLLPPRTIRCHPHLVIGNGLDATHFEALHAMALTSPPRFSARPPHGLALELRCRPHSPVLRRLVGGEVAASFEAVGGSLALTTIHEPVRLRVLFSGRPTADGHCETQTVLFLPRGGAAGFARLARAAPALGLMLREDNQILDSISFSPGYTENDAGLREFARVVDAMEVW